MKLCALLKAGYKADQPRAPEGSPEGGQWVDDGVPNKGEDKSFNYEEWKATVELQKPKRDLDALLLSLSSRWNISVFINEKVKRERALEVLSDFEEVFTSLVNSSRVLQESLLGKYLMVSIEAGARIPSVTHPGKTALATYNKVEHKITLAAGLSRREKTSLPKLGDWLIGSDLRTVLAHEIGHAVTSKVLQAWARTLPDPGGLDSSLSAVYNSKPKAYWEKNVSGYSATNAREMFAEAFSAYTHPRYKESKRKLPPEIVSVFTAAGLVEGVRKVNLAEMLKGAPKGHPFYGNQWTTMYHGSPRGDINEFDPARPLFLTDDPEVAAEYARRRVFGASNTEGNTPTVYEVQVDTGRRFNAELHGDAFEQARQEFNRTNKDPDQHIPRLPGRQLGYGVARQLPRLLPQFTSALVDEGAQGLSTVVFNPQGRVRIKGKTALLGKAGFDPAQPRDEKGQWSLTGHEQYVVDRYKGTGYQIYNDYLRTPQELPNKHTEEEIGVLDSLISRSPEVAEGTVVFRALTGKRVGDRYLTEGAILQERAFLSTSSEEVGAFRSQKDIGGRGPVTLLEIEVPKGFRAFPLEGRQTGAFLPSQGQARENELLFPRGTKMQVLSVDKEARRAKVRLIAETEGSRRNAATVALVDAIASRRPTVPRKGNPYVRGYKVGRKFLLSSLLKAGYRPDQRRAPKGSSEGGQWTAGPNYHYDKDAGGWIDAQGKLLSAKVIERLKKLRVPPGWQGVVLNPDLQAALQAIGFDTKGRKQYLYSAEHSERAAAEKFARLQEFSKHLPRMRTLIESWLTNTKLSYKDRDAAAVLRMIERTGIRIGGTAETLAAAKAYGAATLLVSHVSYSGDRIKLDFIGKKGVRNERAFTDKELAAYIRERKGRRSTGSLWEVSPGYVRTAFERMGFSDFSPKDFRTWHGTSQALLEVKRHPKPRTDKEMKKLRTAVGKHVAAYLGNTPAVALSSYVDPAVFRSRL